MDFASNILKKEKQNYLLFCLVFLLCMLTILSCATSASSNTKIIADLELYELDIDEMHSYLVPLYYRDIISFNADNSTGSLITYNAESDRYYVPGKTAKTVKAGSYNIEFVPVTGNLFAGFVYVGSGTILYSDNDGNISKTVKNKDGKWEEKSLFNAKLGQKPFNAMTADQKNIYLYSQKDGGIYRFDYSGTPEAFIKISGINRVSALDIKSDYLYMLSSSGLIVLADYRQDRIEIEYIVNDKSSFNTALLIKQNKTESEIILNRDGIKGFLNYAVYPLSSLHKMRIEEGYIKKISPPMAGCSYVLTDSSGKIVFPVKSTLINLDTALSVKVTVTGMIYDAENTKILVVSAIDN